MQVVKTENNLICARFDHEYSLLSVGTKSYFNIFDVKEDPIKLLYTSCVKESYGLVESVEDLTFVVESQNNKQLQIWNSKQGAMVHNIHFSSMILTCIANKKYLLLCFELEILIYKIDTMKSVAKLRTVQNIRGVVSMTHSEPFLIAFPSRSDRGDFTIYDLESFDYIQNYSEHESPIKYLQFDHSCNRIASVSLSGRYIKVHSVYKNEQPIVFKRGNTKANVSAPVFSKDDKYLVCASERTVHIFDLNVVYTFFQVLSGIRAFCTITLPNQYDSIFGFSEDSTRLYIVTKDGYFAKYSWSAKSKNFKFVCDYNIVDVN